MEAEAVAVLAVMPAAEEELEEVAGRRKGKGSGDARRGLDGGPQESGDARHSRRWWQGWGSWAGWQWWPVAVAVVAKAVEPQAQGTARAGRGIMARAVGT